MVLGPRHWVDDVVAIQSIETAFGQKRDEHQAFGLKCIRPFVTSTLYADSFARRLAN